jgi:hypothetical protein
VRIGRLTDWMLDAAAVSVTVVVGVLVIGRFLDSKPAHALDATPIAGDVVEGIRNAWHHVYDPTNAP